MPEVSIIVPVYNAEEKIVRCINSILSQTFKDFELILIDDGSLDKSGRICDEYAKKDNRIKVIYQKNRGAADARNAGIKAAKGIYIGFVDSDDYIQKTFIYELLTQITNKNCDLAICNISMVQDDMVISTLDHSFTNDTVLNKQEIITKVYSNIFDCKNTSGYFSLCNKIFRRDIIHKNGLFLNNNMSFGEDMLFVMQYLEFCRSIVFLSMALYYYDQTPTGLFSKYRRTFINDISTCYKQIIEQTAPQNYSLNDLLPLNLKYFNYINRHFSGIIRCERHKFLQILNVLKNETVRKIFSDLSSMTAEQAEEARIQQNELKPARLIKRNLLFAAAFVLDYQFNPNFWVRKIKNYLFH